MSRDARYVLMTPARDEARHIRLTLDSVVNQNVRPVRWVIVSDNSSDETPEIVGEYAREHEFIELVELTQEGQRTFSSKVWALNEAYQKLEGIDYEFIGNLDGDMSFEPDFYERLLGEFAARPRLGLASGVYVEHLEGGRTYESPATYTPGALQLFRRQCYEEIGGYRPMRTGGIDTLAEIMVRMNGWEVKAFSELKTVHHKPGMLGGASSNLRSKFRQGQRDYNIGMHPLFMAGKAAVRLKENPWVIGSLTRLAGFGACWMKRQPRDVPPEAMQYLRQMQNEKIRALFGLGGRGGVAAENMRPAEGEQK